MSSFEDVASAVGNGMAVEIWHTVCSERHACNALGDDHMFLGVSDPCYAEENGHENQGRHGLDLVVFEHTNVLQSAKMRFLTYSVQVL